MLLLFLSPTADLPVGCDDTTKTSAESLTFGAAASFLITRVVGFLFFLRKPLSCPSISTFVNGFTPQLNKPLRLAVLVQRDDRFEGAGFAYPLLLGVHYGFLP